MLADVMSMCTADVMPDVTNEIPWWQMLLPHSCVGKHGRRKAIILLTDAV